jgi:predicted  nucleic acid-binding Zn-ribbon protein
MGYLDMEKETQEVISNIKARISLLNDKIEDIANKVLKVSKDDDKFELYKRQMTEIQTMIKSHKKELETLNDKLKEFKGN